jgi:hypothetical protein
MEKSDHSFCIKERAGQACLLIERQRLGSQRFSGLQVGADYCPIRPANARKKFPAVVQTLPIDAVGSECLSNGL